MFLCAKEFVTFARFGNARAARMATHDACPLVWMEHLWLQAGREDQWPDSKLVAQTTLSPSEAACMFAETILPEAEARLVQELLMKRKEKHKGEFLTFRVEFLFVASVLQASLLLLVVGQGGLVKSVQLCTPGEKPRAVQQEEAQHAFDAGTVAVAIDFEATRTVTAYCWPKYWKTFALMGSIADLDFPPKVPTALATGPLADAVVKAWGGNDETRRRIERAKQAILKHGLW